MKVPQEFCIKRLIHASDAHRLPSHCTSYNKKWTETFCKSSALPEGGINQIVRYGQFWMDYWFLEPLKSFIYTDATTITIMWGFYADPKFWTLRGRVQFMFCFSNNLFLIFYIFFCLWLLNWSRHMNWIFSISFPSVFLFFFFYL